MKGTGGTQGARYVSRTFAEGERESFFRVEKEVVIRRTRTGKQQVRAFFLVDDRGIRTLTLQRFSTDPEWPHEEANFSLRGDEISQLLDLSLLIRTATFEGQDKVRLELGDLDNFNITPDAIRALVSGIGL